MNDLTDKYVGHSGKWNPNFLFIEKEIKNYRILVLQGGTRSGKTYATLQWIWRQLKKHTHTNYSISRHTYNSLKGSALRDFINIGESVGLYSKSYHNQSSNEYRYNKNLLDYFGADNDEKIRGPGRDLLYLNEGPEMPWIIARQLIWRTTSKIIIDYNPSYPESWLYDNILTRDDCAMIRTTYKDNPFLSKGQYDEIEWMRINDPETYKVYGLGERGELRGQIYKNWKRIKPDQYPGEYSDIFVIDFGFSNHPACIAKFCKHNRTLYGKELVYSTGLDNLDIGIHLFFHGVTSEHTVIADSAEPKSIGELRFGWQLDKDYVIRKAGELGYWDINWDEKADELLLSLRNGFTIVGALKGKDSINAGIQKVKQFEVLITEDSLNAWREYRKYKWAEDPKTGELLNNPIDEWNHFCDCLRMFALAEGRLY